MLDQNFLSHRLLLSCIPVVISLFMIVRRISGASKIPVCERSKEPHFQCVLTNFVAAFFIMPLFACVLNVFVSLLINQSLCFLSCSLQNYQTPFFLCHQRRCRQRQNAGAHLLDRVHVRVLRFLLFAVDLETSRRTPAHIEHGS
jgi:hypothetical protein